MSKIRFLTLAVALLILLNLGTLAFFLMGRKPPHQSHEGPKKIIIERLRFQPDQVAAYEKLIGQHRSAIQEKEQEMAAAKKQLYALLKQDSFPQKEAFVAQINQAQQAIEQIHFNHFFELKALCTPEQQPLFDALTEDLAAYFGPQRPMRNKPK